MAPFRDTFIKRFQTETGIKVKYNETSYDAWYQNAKNDGLNKTGAYDIYVMDDNWVPEFAAGNIIKNLDEIGFKANSDILPEGPRPGLLAAALRRAPEGLRQRQAGALRGRDHRRRRDPLLQQGLLPGGAPKTWDDIAKVAAAKSKPGKLYGWSARGVKGNPIVQTYLPLLNSYGGNFVNDDWSPGFAGPEGVGALERLLSFIPYMPAGVAEFDTDQETQVLLQGKCTALTEYTGLVHRVDDTSSSQVVGKIDMAATPSQEKSGPGDRHFHLRHRVGREEPRPPPSSSSSGSPPSKVQTDFAREGGSAAVTGCALSDPARSRSTAGCRRSRTRSTTRSRSPRRRTSRSSRTSSARTSTRRSSTAIQKKCGFTQIAQKQLKAAANEISAFIKQQGGYV